MKLRISDDIALPLDAVTSTVVVVGIRGSGKSTTAVDMAEEMVKAGQQIIVLDPKDDWWGMRSSADGKSEGLPITILGGSHQDAPLEHTAGKLVAEIILNEHISCILSMRHFSDGQRFRFIYDLMDYFVRHCQDPMHLFADEADQIAPQEKQNKTQRGDSVSESMMLSLVRRAIKTGRTGGLGMTFITQSPAAFDKRTMNMCETMIAMRVIGKQDFEQVESWFKVNIRDHDELEKIVSQLPTLQTGTGILYSPYMMKSFRVARFRMAETFDSRQTPKVGQRRIEPKVLAPVDLQMLSAKMAETIERVKADDPKELRRQIAELQKKLSARPAQIQLQAERIEVPVVRDNEIGKLEQIALLDQGRLKDWQNLLAKMKDQIAVINTSVDVRRKSQDELVALIESAKRLNHSNTMPHFVSERSRQIATPVRSAENGDELKRGEKIMLTAIAQSSSRGIVREQLSALVKYKKTSRDTFLKNLARVGYVYCRDDKRFVVTEAGMEKLGSDYQPLPTGKDLIAYWMRELIGGERAIFEIAIKAHPDEVERSTLDELIGYKKTSRDTFIKRLVARYLIATQRNSIRASDVLFE